MAREGRLVRHRPRTKSPKLQSRAQFDNNQRSAKRPIKQRSKSVDGHFSNRKLVASLLQKRTIKLTAISGLPAMSRTGWWSGQVLSSSSGCGNTHKSFVEMPTACVLVLGAAKPCHISTGLLDCGRDEISASVGRGRFCCVGTKAAAIRWLVTAESGHGVFITCCSIQHKVVGTWIYSLKSLFRFAGAVHASIFAAPPRCRWQQQHAQQGLVGAGQLAARPLSVTPSGQWPPGHG
jgi:hypothetical protein